MTSIRTILTATCMLAAMVLLASVTRAQTVPSAPPQIPVSQAPPLPELLKKLTAPAMSLADVPLTPEEASGAVPALTVKNASGGRCTYSADGPGRRGAQGRRTQTGAVPAAATPMTYHGGPVMIYPQLYCRMAARPGIRPNMPCCRF
jgi:hypothetical protein